MSPREDDLNEVVQVRKYEWIFRLPNQRVNLERLAEELDSAVGGGVTYWKTQGVGITGKPEDSVIFMHIRVGHLEDSEKENIAAALVFWARQWGVSNVLTNVTISHAVRLLMTTPHEREDSGFQPRLELVP